MVASNPIKTGDAKATTRAVRRRSPPASASSTPVSSIHDVELVVRDEPSSSSSSSAPPLPSSSSSSSSVSVHAVVKSTAFARRLSRQSSLPWGHRPSPYIGASCVLFLLPVPLLYRACRHSSALLLTCVSLTSYLSDHVYTGLESYAHTVDRVVAPLAFASCIRSTYVTCGPWWAMVSIAALKCHVWANYYAKKGMYEEFVIWHCLWHAVGPAVQH